MTDQKQFMHESWGMHHQPDDCQASPERLAYEAYERGDLMFQLDITVSAVQGYSQLGTSSTRTIRSEPRDFLGAIEQQGWRLEHVSTAFVQTGTSASKRVLGNAGSTEVGVHGQLVALYVFRRTERPA